MLDAFITAIIRFLVYNAKGCLDVARLQRPECKRLLPRLGGLSSPTELLWPIRRGWEVGWKLPFCSIGSKPLSFILADCICFIHYLIFETILDRSCFGSSSPYIHTEDKHTSRRSRTSIYKASISTRCRLFKAAATLNSRLMAVLRHFR